MDTINNEMKISITPIVGEITENGVIFLVVTQQSISVDLYINGTYYQSYKTNDIIPTRIFIPIAPNYHDDTVYVWRHKSQYDAIISEHKLKLSYDKMIFLSCDLPEADTNHSLWMKLSNEEKNGICFHLGDNIYGDRAYNTCGHDYNSTYIKTWSRWSPIMNDFSHMMVADDHEICDGYDYTVASNDAIAIGLLAYKQYQTGLLQQVNSFPGFFVKVVDEDTTVYGISRSMMGVTPLSLIQQIKNNFSGNVILAISSAPVPLPPGLSRNIYELIYGSFGWEQSDLISLYDLCFECLESGQVKKFILIGVIYTLEYPVLLGNPINKLMYMFLQVFPHIRLLLNIYQHIL